jgi:hypothetical protein
VGRNKQYTMWPSRVDPLVQWHISHWWNMDCDHHIYQSVKTKYGPCRPGGFTC